MRDFAAPGPSPLDQAAAAEAKRLVRSAVAGLPERQRLVVLLVYGEERSLTAIAADWHVSVAAVCQAHTRALRRLRAAMIAAGVAQLNEVL